MLKNKLEKKKKPKYLFGFSENSNDSNNNFIDAIYAHKTSSSESFNKYTQLDYVFDTNFFTRELQTFSCIAFLSTGSKILPLKKLTLTPHFISDKNLNEKNL